MSEIPLKITSIIVTCHRLENLPKVIAGIRAQTIPSEIWIWDNYGDVPMDMADVVIRSSRNFYCHPRFLIAGMVQTPYIFNTDDDLAIKDLKLFEKLIETSEKYPGDFIGWNGRQFIKGMNWDKAYSFPGKGFCDDVNMAGLDVMNVGVSFFNTAMINALHMNPYTREGLTEEEMKHADDIWISHQIPKDRQRITSYLRPAMEYLDEFEDRGFALSKRPPHMNLRDKVIQKLFEEPK